MSRITTSNYGAAPTTIFAWATTDDDQFDRELDLYHLSQALENHTHGAARGLAVERLAAGAIDAAAMGALSVGTTALQNASVTNAKLAAGAVTRDKMTFPLVQPADTMTGGFSQRDTTNTYALGFYQAQNGLAVWGTGTIATIGTNIIMGQAGEVSIGPSNGTGRLNVLQGANTYGSGLRVYNTNVSFVADLYSDASANVVLGNSNLAIMWMGTTGRVSIGSATLSNGRLSITQLASGNDQGVYLTFSSGVGRWYVDASNNINLASATASVQLMHAAATFAPSVNQGTHLGQSGQTWANCYVAALFVTGAASFGGALTGVTTMTMSGGLTATTGTFSGAVSAASYGAVSGTTGTFSGAVSAASVSITPGQLVASGGLKADSMMPLVDGAGAIGTTGQVWSAISVHSGFKDSGGSWSVLSDARTKYKTDAPFTEGLEVLLQLQPVRFKYNGQYGTTKDRAGVGFRAEPLLEIAPEMVSTIKAKKTQKDSEPEEDIFSVNVSQLDFIMLNAIKELHARVSTLEAH